MVEDALRTWPKGVLDYVRLHVKGFTFPTHTQNVIEKEKSSLSCGIDSYPSPPTNQTRKARPDKTFGKGQHIVFAAIHSGRGQ